jgi:hypothetical protein
MFGLARLVAVLAAVAGVSANLYVCDCGDPRFVGRYTEVSAARNPARR